MNLINHSPFCDLWFYLDTFIAFGVGVQSISQPPNPKVYIFVIRHSAQASHIEMNPFLTLVYHVFTGMYEMGKVQTTSCAQRSSIKHEASTRVQIGVH